MIETLADLIKIKHILYAFVIVTPVVTRYKIYKAKILRNENEAGYKYFLEECPINLEGNVSKFSVF
jgi:hypothetical protein